MTSRGAVSRLVGALMVAVAAVGVSGCTDDPYPPKYLGVESPTAAVATEVADGWVITPTSIGPVALGDDYAEALDGLGVEPSSDCTSTFVEHDGGASTLVVTSDGGDPAKVGFVAIMRTIGIPLRPGARTAEGIDLTSAREDVAFTYPDAETLHIESWDPSAKEFAELTTSEGRIVFVFDDYRNVSQIAVGGDVSASYCD